MFLEQSQTRKLVYRVSLSEQPVQALRPEPLAPFADSLRHHPQLARHAFVRPARRTAENHAGAWRQRLRGGRSTRPALQSLALGIGDRQRGSTALSACVLSFLQGEHSMHPYCFTNLKLRRIARTIHERTR